MHINRVRLEGFTVHKQTELTLPKQGVVVVTAPNGHGKSSILEGVAFGLWGKTLRGAPPWSGKAGLVEVSVTVGKDEITVLRSQDKSIFVKVNGKPTHYETATKAQKAIIELVGEFDVWRRCAVFSSGDAAHFSQATDSERKTLLERVVGVDIFDDAVDTLKAKLTAAQSEAAAADAAKAAVTRVIASSGHHLLGAEEALASLQNAVKYVECDKLREEVASSEGLLKEAQGQVKEGKALVRSITEDEANARAQHQQVERRCTQAERYEGKLCPTCEQAWPSGTLAPLREELANAKVVLTRIAETRSIYTAMLSESEEMCTVLTEKVRNTERALQRAEVAKAKLDAAKAEVLRIVQQRETAEAEVAQHETKRAALSKTCAELKLALDVVGLKGVRATLLSEAVDQFSALAQEHVGRFSPGVRLTVNPYTAKSTIDFDVTGVGGGSYKGASQGERRRLDIALMLALGELEAAYHGVGTSTLWVDEAFDALDTAGIEALGEALVDLASNRCVFVITHSPDVVRGIPSVASYTIENGVMS